MLCCHDNPVEVPSYMIYLVQASDMAFPHNKMSCFKILDILAELFGGKCTYIPPIIGSVIEAINVGKNTFSLDDGSIMRPSVDKDP